MTSPRATPSKEAYDASDPKAIKAAAQRKELRDEGIKKWLLESLQNPAARNWFWDLLEAGHMVQTSFVQGDPMATSFNEGERNGAIKVFNEISQVAPEQLVQILHERGQA